jgi:adenine-specific DNA-methyltransferase
VGALIGIHNPRGEKVGQVSHTRNKEMLFVATKSKAVADALEATGAEQPTLW